MWIGYWPQEMHLEMILTYSCLRKPRRIAKSEKRKDAQVSDSSREETRFHHEWGKHSESESESESSFQKVVEMGVPCNECVEEKLRWLRSQIIGNSAEFDSPFGRRIVVYADHTASARSLRYNENFIADHLLPFYGTCVRFLHLYFIHQSFSNQISTPSRFCFFPNPISVSKF